MILTESFHSPLKISPLIAHRGASAYAPENTLTAFNKAYHLGCDWIEVDVTLSADGEPFIFHDERLNRTSNGKGKIWKASAETLKNLDAGLWFAPQFKGEKIPHLLDLIHFLASTSMQVNLELKPYVGQGAHTALVVLDYLRQYWPSSKPLPLLSSFDKEALETCHAQAFEFPRGLLCHRWKKVILAEAKALSCASIHLNKNILNPARIEAIKSAGYPLFAYTVNDKKEAEYLFQQGVDAIFSDYADLLNKDLPASTKRR